MGAGKSSVGTVLHEKLGVPCVDLDRLVEEKAGATIAQIFARGGEDEFRILEEEALSGLSQESRRIVITGGGIVGRPENRAKLKQLGEIVWLDASEEILFERATRDQNRPLLQADDPRAAFTKLYEARRPLYSEIAAIRIDTGELDPGAVADRLIAQMRGKKSPP